MQSLLKSNIEQTPAAFGTPSPCPESTATGFAVTELIMTRHSPDQAMVLLPMMSHLSQNSSRWVTWISPHRVDRTLLDSYGVDTSKIRLIYADEGKDSRWLVWEALQAGTSECVVATPGTLTEDDMEHLRQAANQGQSHGLLIHYR